MISALAYVVIALAAGMVIWGLISAVVDRPPGRPQLLFAAAVELVVAVQSVLGFVRLAQGPPPAETATTIGYLLGILVLIPAAWFWANVERTRFSGVVLAVAGAGVLAMTFRLLQLWPPG